MEFRTVHGRRIQSGVLITNGKAVFEVQCISMGTAWCKRIEACEDDARFYRTVEDIEFSSSQIAEMWHY